MRLQETFLLKYRFKHTENLRSRRKSPSYQLILLPLLSLLSTTSNALALDGPLAARSTGTANITLYIPERAEILPLGANSSDKETNQLCLTFSNETSSFLLSPLPLKTQESDQELQLQINDSRYELKNNTTEEIVLPPKQSSKTCENGYSLSILADRKNTSLDGAVALIFEPS